MRVVLLLMVFVGFSGILNAQDPVPDTTEAWRYFPLEVGNVWEYSVFVHATPMPPEYGFERRTVVGDSTVEGRVYRKFFVEQYDEGGFEIGLHTRVYRLDTLSAEILKPEFGGGERVVFGTACGLDAPFPPKGSEIECVSGSYLTGVGYNQTVDISGDQVILAVKSFYEYPGGNFSFGADIGLIENQGCEGGCWDYDLVYASVDGVEYGTPFPVSVESGLPVSSQLVIDTVYPNPTSGDTSIVLSVDQTQSVRIDVYDLLGRRLHVHEQVITAGRTTVNFESSDWPRGTYIIRAATSGGETATTHVTRL